MENNYLMYIYISWNILNLIKICIAFLRILQQKMKFQELVIGNMDIYYL